MSCKQRRLQQREAGRLLAKLPNEILRHIILQLSNPNDFDSVRLVCKRFAFQTPSVRDQLEVLNVFRWSPSSYWRVLMKNAAVKYEYEKHECCDNHFSKQIGDTADGKKLEFFMTTAGEIVIFTCSNYDSSSFQWYTFINDVVAPNWDLLLSTFETSTTRVQFYDFIAFKGGLKYYFNADTRSWDSHLNK